MESKRKTIKVSITAADSRPKGRLPKNYPSLFNMSGGLLDLGPSLLNMTALPKIEPTVFNFTAALPKFEPTVFHFTAALPKFEPTVFNFMTALPKIEPTVFNFTTALPKIEPSLLGIIAALPKVDLFAISGLSNVVIWSPLRRLCGRIKKRYEQYLNGKEPLPGNVYACLTLLELFAGGRKAAAHTFGISLDVLRKMAYLSSQVGDALTARKFTRHQELRPHTRHEIAWLEAAVVRIVLRLEQLQLGQNHGPITMAELPSLRA